MVPQYVTPSASHSNTKPSSSSSSPTALGLLLKSSVFRELMQQNLKHGDDGKGEQDYELENPQEGSDGVSYLNDSGLPNLQSLEERQCHFIMYGMPL